jgi:large subunit ribosomal protein L6e
MGKEKRGREVVPGVSRKGRAASSKGGRYKFFKKGAAGKKTASTKAAKQVQTKEPRWYAADDVKRPLTSRKNRHRRTRLRSTIVPGTVLILLAGRFKGKRVVFLKQLASGLLLVTGPFKVNGVPLRRVNQAYVIATSTRLEGFEKLEFKIGDKFFARVESDKKAEDSEFIDDSKKKTELSQARKDEQKKVDAQLKPLIKKEVALYLGARFTLRDGQAPHTLKF